jgi:CHASE2 domain
MKKRKLRSLKPLAVTSASTVSKFTFADIPVWLKLKNYWNTFSSFKRHWLQNIVLGVLIELFIHIGGHTFHLSPIVNFQNWGLDVVTRLNVAACSGLGVADHGPQASSGRFLKCPLMDSQANVPFLVDIDAQTWRDTEWGGGEPYRAPRNKLIALIDQSFERGAKQVVVDIVVEDGTSQASNAAVKDDRAKLAYKEDQDFADGLRILLGKKYFETDRKLILVRTVRAPLSFESDTRAYLGELRTSAAVDKVIAESKNRIVVAAPYFQESTDRITRDWDLFKVVCERKLGESDHGQLRVVPSVQLVTTQHLLGVNSDVKQDVEAKKVKLVRSCAPYPLLGPSTLPEGDSFAQACLLAIAVDGSSAAVEGGICKKAKQICETVSKTDDFSNFSVCPSLLSKLKLLTNNSEHNKNDGLSHEYWSDVQSSIDAKFKLADLPHQGGLGNRIVFRYNADQVMAGNSKISAVQLLALPMDHRFEGRTVVIGQTYQETGDFFNTPVGRMPGAVLLINAIDSMKKHQLMKPPSGFLTFSVAFALIVFVGFLFARWDSSMGAVLAVIAVVLTAGVASFFFFAHGVWFDFAAPIIGIQLHRQFAAWEERSALKRLKRTQMEAK